MTIITFVGDTCYGTVIPQRRAGHGRPLGLRAGRHTAADCGQPAAVMPVGRLYTVKLSASAGEEALRPHRKAGQQKPVHSAGAPPDLLRGRQQCPPANAVRRRPAQNGARAGRYRPHDLRRHRTPAALAGGVSGRKPRIRLRMTRASF